MEAEQSFNDILRELDEAINELDNPKNENYSTRHKTVYDEVAQLAGLEHKYGNIYVSKENGKQFIRTKFGFQPEEAFNKGLQLTQLKVKHEGELETLKNELSQTKIFLQDSLKSNEGLNKRLELYMVSIDKLTLLKKEMSLKIEDLTEKNNSLNIEKIKLNQSTNSGISNLTLEYHQRKIAELTLLNKKLSREIEILEKKNNAYMIMLPRKWK